MKPPRFTYHRPACARDAVDLLAEYGDDAKVLAGGQSLIPMLNLRLATPAHVVDILGAPDLAELSADDDALHVGAGVRQSRLEDSAVVADLCPLLREALPHVAHREIRNAGTVCGSAAHADPAAEIPTVALAADASFEVTGGGGARTVSADDFYTGYLQTAVQPDELLTAISFPRPNPGTGTAFLEVAQRKGDYALAGVAASVRIERGRVSCARVSYLGVGLTPVRSTEVETLLADGEPGEELFGEAAATAARTVDCIDGVHASAAYRRHAVAVLTQRALATATARAAGSLS